MDRQSDVVSTKLSYALEGWEKHFEGEQGTYLLIELGTTAFWSAVVHPCTIIGVGISINAPAKNIGEFSQNC